ncbi:metal-sulfur cluster assembly factor [Leptospira levettii]|uniref:Metal-sulfur cluster assembly factor n=1 Tax=Leptospira levettii TaxID=2023178 RepID=A0ABY2MNC7_9LEPT|nr:metal-sulfur cluster assembly factor [Leptospira levettii]TGL70820.1 metal-sulfur cluster assembly factor [Leptospira levettii]TGM28027.1 metal-sulfur cluster assembly factor [Leptospira levettii]
MIRDPETEKEWEVYHSIRTVEDPEIGISLVELGLIYDVKVEGEKAEVTMTYTSLACPAGPQMKQDIENHALRVDGISEVVVHVVWNPKWEPRSMASEEAKMQMGIFD